MNRYDVAPREPAAAAAELNGGVGSSEAGSPTVWNAARNYGYRRLVKIPQIGEDAQGSKIPVS